MNKVERDIRAKRVVHFFENVTGRDKKRTLNHFKEEGMPERSIYAILKRYEEYGTVITMSPSGRPRAPGREKLESKVEKLIEKDRSITSSTGGAKLGISKSYFNKIKVHNLGIKGYKKIKAPKYVKDQENRAKKSCRKIYRKKLLQNRDKTLLIDDETYVVEDPKLIPGKEFYHCRDKSEVAVEDKIQLSEKYPQKYLIWQCLDENGNVSKPYVYKGTINGQIYLKECLKKRLMPFVKKHHKIENVVFWADLASSHYTKDVLEWLESQGIDYIEKKENAPNVPQARPIEKFWALCKREYKKRSNGAINIKSMTKIWTNISEKIASESAQKLMREARRNLRAIGYGGVRAPIMNTNK
jgi:hypothetical protein